METPEKQLVQEVCKAVKGVRISKRKRSVFLKDFRPSDFPDEVQGWLRALAVDYKYRFGHN